MLVVVRACQVLFVVVIVSECFYIVSEPFYRVPVVIMFLLQSD